MDKDRIEGKINDIKGSVERKVGEWTGDKETQAEGIKDQIKGKVQNAYGKIKDAGREVANKVDKKTDTTNNEKSDRDRDKDVA